MEFEIEEHTQAFVGVAFHDKVIFNVVENDGSFMGTGLSIVQYLKNDRNQYVAKIIESQSYDSIKYIFDDKMIYNDFYDLTNENRESFQDILELIRTNDLYEHFYIYDIESDTLVVKIPEIDSVFAIDYKNSSDVRDIINSIN